jgi:cytochrome c-type protein NapC
MDNDNSSSLWSKIRNRAYWPVLIVGMVAGIIFWGGFNTAMEATNTMTFCISCHEMRDNVYQEYKETVHYKNPSGVQATCSDCHVPRPWIYKVIRKIEATRELYHKALGTIDTPEKFEAHRLQLAERVWKSMRETDSRECRNCHDFKSMDLSEQDRYARKRHERALAKGETCIDCHDGIAHELPVRPDEDGDDEGEDE